VRIVRLNRVSVGRAKTKDLSVAPFARLLQTRHYDRTKGRYSSTAFQPSSDGGGTTVIDICCIAESGHSVCDHISKYYPVSVASSPAIYWIIPDSIIPKSAKIIQQTSESGDIRIWRYQNLAINVIAIFLTGQKESKGRLSRNIA
jgi:hypothetical protein